MGEVLHNQGELDSHLQLQTQIAEYMAYKAGEELIPPQRQVTEEMLAIGRASRAAFMRAEQRAKQDAQEKALNILDTLRWEERAKSVVAESLTSDDANWREFAACRYVDPETFFPVTHNQKAARKAAKICASCPVAQLCLAEAIDYTEYPEHGVWGGTTKRQRNALINKYQATTSLTSEVARKQLAAEIRTNFYNSLTPTDNTLPRSA